MTDLEIDIWYKWKISKIQLKVINYIQIISYNLKKLNATTVFYPNLKLLPKLFKNLFSMRPDFQLHQFKQ